jgi:hypothetical protein
MKSNYHLKIYRINDYDQLPKLKFAEFPFSDSQLGHFVYISPIFIQLPRGVIKKDIASKVIKVEFSSTDLTLIKKYLINPIEEDIKESVYKNSNNWFNKTFTFNKIDSSLMSKLGETSIELIIDNNSKFYDQFDEKIKTPSFNEDFQLSFLPIIKLTCLEFIGSKFTYHLVLEQGKVSIEKVLDSYAIKDDISTISSNCSENKNI